MNENNEFTQVQRRLCAVMAKSEWTSSRMRMQKSGDELRDRRAKSHRTANKFLQELLEKRSDGDLIDDHGAVDRYNRFLKSKTALNDGTNTTLDEFDRRLRALNERRRQPSSVDSVKHAADGHHSEEATSRPNGFHFVDPQYRDDENGTMQILYDGERVCKPERRARCVA